jgi:phenylpropionate dioxygenase-like ring-hydroxylating dioxygenase large terminal subunit
MAMKYLRNSWYQIGWSGDAPVGGLFARTIMDVPLVVWRSNAGGLCAWLDRCPHRFAPLSAGTVSDNVLVCGYHGLAFDRMGACAHNPHGATSSALRVETFPTLERHGAIWVWMGQADRADATLLPDLSFIDETPEDMRIITTLPTAANYQLVSDNVLDLSHLDYLHPTTVGGMMKGATCKSRVDAEKIIVEWTAKDGLTPSGLKAMVPEGRCDVYHKLTWRPPGLMVLSTTVVAAGSSPQPINERLTLHNVTPESGTTTHYFVCSTRRFAPGNADITAKIRAALMKAFVEEDKPMIEKQQARMGTADLWSLKPALLKTDSGAVWARRKLDALIEAETDV